MNNWCDLYIQTRFNDSVRDRKKLKDELLSKKIGSFTRRNPSFTPFLWYFTTNHLTDSATRYYF
ncbi:hypothetical protein SAMN04487894_12224 [Niabella drilacis]|uniref:Uncharacterized protein n=1 Tax=Niabella drilacis (strain DSM 25811 / CCM 8410 / CCUG 62505 / LMG 26954 / E90) TaxID=1285928 RepID=A0A1G7AAQ3_NIADE|nr:hypothetical protein SAMN04487894_12224 [Niabella drilacis]